MKERARTRDTRPTPRHAKIATRHAPQSEESDMYSTKLEGHNKIKRVTHRRCLQHLRATLTTNTLGEVVAMFRLAHKSSIPTSPLRDYAGVLA